MATSTELQFLITAKDEASSVMNGLTGAISSNKEALASLGVAAGIAFAAITDEIKEATDAASKHQNIEAQLQAVLTSTKDVSGATAEGINQLAESLMLTTGYSKDTILSVDNLLLGFTNISSQTMPAATQAILDFANRTGNDAVSSTMLLGRALDDPTKGMTALRREGLVLSAQQQQMVKDFQASGDMANAQGVILDALKTKYGGAAEQSNTMAFQQRLLTSQIEEMQISIGTALLPVLTSMMEKIEPIITAVVKWTEAHPELTKWIIILAGVVTGLIAGLTLLAGAVLLVNIAMSPITLIILAVVAAIALLIADAVLIITHWTQTKDFFASLWKEIEKIFSDSINAVIAFFKPLTDVIDSIVAKIQAVGNGIASVANSVGGAVSGAVHAIVPHASGGSVNPYGTYLVGENGPELFTSSVGGSILPNSSLAGAGGGQNININISGAVMSKDAANQLGSIIMQQLRFKTRLGI